MVAILSPAGLMPCGLLALLGIPSSLLVLYEQNIVVKLSSLRCGGLLAAQADSIPLTAFEAQYMAIKICLDLPK